jgi:SAM-dependent methyltransferase
MSWVLGPRYVLRRYCALRLIEPLRPARVLEVGCGAGELLAHLAAQGCDAVGVEGSAQAREEARARGAGRLSIRSELPDGQFDLVMAFEVLEHIERDAEALADWVRRLAPGGHLLLSVPAHHRRWGPSDVWAGHFRRYERAELAERLRAAGLRVLLVWSYGFPLANWVEPLQEWLATRRNARETDMTPAQRTARSGVERGSLERLGARLASGPLLLPFCWLQLAFLERDWGNGYLALARREA